MDINKSIIRALLTKDFAAAKEGVFTALYTKAGQAMEEAKAVVREAVFNAPKGGEQLDEVSPPGMEKMTGSKKTKASFAKQYGKRGKSVMYATAWKQYNKKAKD
jgi:hypothetical protein